MISNTFRKIIDSNIYFSEFVKSSIGRSYNKKMEDFIRKCSDVDSIDNINNLRNLLKEIPAQILGSSYSLKHSYGENTLYGYADSVLKYAGLNRSDIFYLPSLEHGISVDNVFGQSTKKTFIFEGRYKENFWKNHSKAPVHFIGPYIHYASDYYDEKKLQELKEKWGKTLLVFPPHSTEIDKTDYTLNRFDNYLFNKIGKQFDTIVACVYWANVNDDYFKSLRVRGVKLVSAGFKLDPLFVHRLRTIINLSDTVLYPFFTTSIGYAYYLNKNIICFDSTDEIIQEQNAFCAKEQILLADGTNDMHKEFCRVFPENSNPFNDEQKRLIEKYWGLSELKTPEEIRKIVSENKKYIVSRLGF